MKHLRRLFWTLAALLALAALGAAGLWLGAGTEGSLALALRQAARHLPAGQTLESAEVSGSLRGGGRIGLLRWQQGGLVVEARQIEFGWQPEALFHGGLHLDRLHVAQLSVDDQRPPTGPATPPQSLALPLRVELSFLVERLHWTGPPALEAGALSGHYRYDGTRHALALDSLQVAAGRYSAQASLLARAPLTLGLQLQGQVDAPLPGGARPLPLAAWASLRGDLAGTAAQLALQARLEPARATGPQATQPMRASVTASLGPWAAQPVLQADAAFSGVDLAALWPGAPRTLLDGSVAVQPLGAPADGRWQAQGRLANRLAGPWDLQRLPLSSLQARLGLHHGSQGGQSPLDLDIESLQAGIGGGQLQAQGQWQQAGPAGAAGARSGWQGGVQLQGINPAALHSRLAAAAVDGRLSARAVRQAIEFDAQLHPAGRQPRASGLQGLRLKTASAQGRWAAGTLSLQALQVQTDDARLQGQLDFQPATRAARGSLSLTLPGAQAQMQGSLGPRDGAGELALRITDAARSARWLALLPGAPAPLAQAAWQGSGELTGRWQGGWEALQPGGKGHDELNLQASLGVPLLEMRPAGQGPESALRLRDLRADLAGPLRALDLGLSAALETGTRQLRLQAQGGAGRGAGGGWQARIGTLALQAQDSLRPGTWTLQLSQPLSLDWRPAPGGDTLQAGAGEARLSGPAPGSALLTWQPVRWVRGGGGTGRPAQFSSQGRLQGLPLGWLEVLGNTQLANLGLSGNLVFDGDWDLRLADTLALRASLARRSGDISVQADDDATAGASAAQRINAGVREARLTLSGDGDSLRAALRWDSERAGQVQAELSTRLARSGDAWDWPADAPLAGTLRAQLPRVGVWSVLAPPGWRMRGTLDASATLAGTRRAPQWNGSLQADDLALRSVVEGIELRDGRLRATLGGQRLDIDEFSLRGAGGSGSGGTLGLTGYAAWTPGASGLAALRMELAAQAQGLRVSARADRRLAVSGKLQARLNRAQLELRGALKADQALFILPDETTPSLGADVVVTTASASGSATAAPVAASAVRVVPDVSVTLDLGPDFRLQGRGITTRLAGTLSMRSAAGTATAPRLSGELRAVNGSYKAYGQQLDIEQGVLRFSDPYDNPALDILAIRPNLSQRVGVQISGTALAPRVRLYSDPPLTDSETLAWLVLGRAAANGEAEAAVLQQAALALLGGNGKGLSGGIAEALGLDELSFRGSASNADGSTSGAAVTLGKRLSRNFYVAYERSLAGTLGTFYIFYDLSRRFTLRAQAGEQSAVDLIFTLRYD
jgi:translocation and assembly module TamB